MLLAASVLGQGLFVMDINRFDETIPTMRWIGVGVIIIGVILITRG